MIFDFSEWAVLARKDDTGFGRQAADIRNVLGVGHHFVIPSDRMPGRPPQGLDEACLRPDFSEDQLADLLNTVKGIIFFERYETSHPALLKVARKLGVKSVCVPNWEWFNGEDLTWELCDFFACPTRFTVNIVQGYGWRRSKYVPWTLDLGRFSQRKIQGNARLFIHNAGLVDRDDRKGTQDAIGAFMKARRGDIRLIVRMQKEVPLPRIDSRVEVRIGNLQRPEELYEMGDVAIQPSKMEGIGFMVIEPLCVGLPVITTNYPPMNEFVRQPEMLAKLKWFKRKAYASAWVKHAHLRLAQISDLARKIQWCADNDLATISCENRRFAETLFDPKQLRQVWAECIRIM
jgi:glycosyltransferase involved in cell wall biosynthesis